jgi:squalene synthase HpnC
LAIAVVRRYGLDEVGPVGRDEARRRAAALAHSQYENFTVVSWFLPAALRQHFYNLYAYCRVSDDLGDEVGDPAESERLLAAWRDGLRACYAGAPGHWVFVALAETIAAFEIPPEPFEHLLQAFVQDQRQTRYETYEELLGYCRHSANPVGQLVLYLGGYRDAERQALSDATCTALQLVNFWQDVARDWDKGRVYLPAEDRQRFGVSEEQIAERRCTPGYRELLKFECDRTAALFTQGAALLDLIDGHVRRDVALFTAGGVAILRRIERQGYDTLTRRPALSKAGKIALMVRVLLGGRPWR